MDKIEILSKLLDLEKLIDNMQTNAYEIGIDLGQFFKEFNVPEIIEEVAETSLPALWEMMQEWMETGEGKEKLIKSILSQKDYE